MAVPRSRILELVQVSPERCLFHYHYLYIRTNHLFHHDNRRNAESSQQLLIRNDYDSVTKSYDND